MRLKWYAPKYSWRHSGYLVTKQGELLIGEIRRQGLGYWEASMGALPNRNMIGQGYRSWQAARKAVEEAFEEALSS